MGIKRIYRHSGRQVKSGLEKAGLGGLLDGSVGQVTDFGSGHDLTGHEFEPCADSSEPGAFLGFCVSFSLCPSPTRALSLSLSK